MLWYTWEQEKKLENVNPLPLKKNKKQQQQQKYIKSNISVKAMHL